MRGSSARLVAILCQCDKFLGEALSFLGFGVCRLDVLVLHQLRDQTAQQSLARRRVAAEMAISDEATCHFFVLMTRLRIDIGDVV